MKTQLNSLSQLGQLSINATQKAPAQRQEPRQQRAAQRPQHRPSIGEKLYQIRMTDWEAQWIKSPSAEALVFNPQIQQWEPTPKSALAAVKMSNLLWQEAPGAPERRAYEPYFNIPVGRLEAHAIERGLCVPVTLKDRNAGKADLVHALLAADAKERAERHVHIQASQSHRATARKRADSRLKSLRARAKSAGLADVIRLKAEHVGDEWMLADAGITQLVPFWVSVALARKDRAYAYAMQNGKSDAFWAESDRAAKQAAADERFRSGIVMELLNFIKAALPHQPKHRMFSGGAEEVLAEHYRTEGQGVGGDQLAREFRQYAQQQFVAITSPARAVGPMRQPEEPAAFERLRSKAVAKAPAVSAKVARQVARVAEAGIMPTEAVKVVRAHAVKMAEEVKRPRVLDLMQEVSHQPRRLK